MSDFSPASRQAFHELLDTLREIGDTYFTVQRGIIDEVSAAESYRYLTQFLAVACEYNIDGDPERPMFTRVVSPQRRVYGDNPDAIYCWTRINGERAYRIRGALSGAVYTSVTVHGADPAGGYRERVISALSDREFTVARDGTYELTLSSQPQEGNWLKLEPDAVSVMTRHYFERTDSAQADPDLHIVLRIDPLDAPAKPAPLNDAVMAARLRALSNYMRANTLGTPAPGESPPFPFVSRVPNVLPRPASFGASGVAALGGVDIHYAMAPYLLQPDQALVMEGRLPPCRFANVVLWNMHNQMFDYRSHCTSLNRKQMVCGPDGSFRVVIAHRDPGVPNWLETEGHVLGTIFWRFLLAETDPEEIRCSVRPVCDITSGR